MEQPYIFLIANRTCKLLGAVPISLEGGIAVRSLSQEQLGSIITFRRSTDGAVAAGRKCFLVPHDHPVVGVLTPQQIHLCLIFALNFFASEGGLACDFAFKTQKKKVFRVVGELDLSTRLLSSSAADATFKIVPGTTPAAIDAVFKSCKGAMIADKSLTITLNRFVSALLKDGIDNRIIDLAICLESLFGSSQEVSYRFSVTNTIISTVEPEKRAEVFALLRDLYDTRSRLVHGSDPNKLEKVEANWSKIVDVARLAIAYKLRFLDAYTLAKWESHLLNLTIGTEARVA